MAIDNSQWGLTSTGFYAPTYDEVLDNVEDMLIKYFGQDIVLTSNSNLGILARLFSRLTRANWEQMQLAFYSSFIFAASDAELDYIGGTIGLPRKVDMPSFAQITVTTDGEYLIQAGEEFTNLDGYDFTLLKDIITVQNRDGSWSGTGWVQCNETGADTNVDANTITEESNPDEMILSVTNPEKAGGGQDYETDEVYRRRLRDENAARPGSTEAGIRSALMNLSGVRQVNIVDNPNQDTDDWGNPPNSVHVYVLGGNKVDIAETLADYVAAGAKMVGQVVQKITDATGNPRLISFDFAKEKQIYLKIALNTDDGWNLDDGVQDLKQAIIDFITEMTMGDGVYITKLYPAIYALDGIKDARIKLGTSFDNVKDDDVICERNEVAVINVDQIEVTVDGTLVN